MDGERKDMLNNAFKPSRILMNKIRDKAPSVDSTEGAGRRFGYYEDYDEAGRGYSSILFYVQLGLAEYKDLIHEIAKLIIYVQSGYSRRYTIIPAAFGKGRDFVSDKKYFDMAYSTSYLAHEKIAGTIAKLSGGEASDVPAVIPAFFQKTDARSLYYGKTQFERNDLMIILGKKGEVFFDAKLENSFRSDMKKRVLFVEIDDENVKWIFRDFEPAYI